MLHEELLLVERDLSHLELEAANASGAVGARDVVALRSVRGLPHAANASTERPRASVAALLKALTSPARVVVADLSETVFELPTSRELERAAETSPAFASLSLGAAAEGGQMPGLPHARGCLKALASYDELVAQSHPRGTTS